MEPAPEPGSRQKESLFVKAGAKWYNIRRKSRSPAAPEQGSTTQTQQPIGSASHDSRASTSSQTSLKIWGKLSRKSRSSVSLAPQPEPPSHEIAVTRTIPPVSSPDSLWKEALEKADDSTKAWIRGKEQENGDGGLGRSEREQIEDLVIGTKALEEKCEKESWAVTIRGHSYKLRGLAATLVGYLSSLGDFAINFAPSGSSFAWSALKALMQIPVLTADQMSAVLGVAETVLRVMRRGRVCEVLYLSSENCLDGDDKLQQNLRDILVALYAITLDILAETEKLVSKGMGYQVWRAIVSPSEAQDKNAEFFKLEQRLSHEVQICDAKRSAETAKRAENMLQFLNHSVASLLETIEVNKKLELLNWISSVPFGTHHRLVAEERLAGTCEWLLRRPEFREWEDLPWATVLWLRGCPGTGKTFLTSKVVDRLRDGLASFPAEEAAFAFFYCDRNEDSRRSALSVLQSYVRQLSSAAAFPDHMQSRLKKLCLDGEQNKTTLTLHDCRDQLVESVNLYAKTVFVLDAFDECEPHERKRLLETFTFVIGSSKHPVKIFMNSRPVREVERWLNKQHYISVSVEKEDNHQDIENFIEQRMKKHENWDGFKEDVKQNTMQTLKLKSAGTFQWARLQVQGLLECEMPDALLDRLGQLPEDLDAAYGQIYERLQRRHISEKALVDRAIKWVMVAHEPLSTAKMLWAVRLGDEDGHLTLSAPVTRDSLLHLASNLLVSNNEQDTWRLSHLSVAEYFEEHHWPLQEAQRFAAKICLLSLTEGVPRRLLLENSATGSRDSDSPGTGLQVVLEKRLSEAECEQLFASPFLRGFASRSWIHLVQKLDVPETTAQEVSDLLKRFLGSPSRASPYFKIWTTIDLCELDHRMELLPGVQKGPYYIPLGFVMTPVDTPFWAMCAFSIYFLLETDWWTEPWLRDIDVDEINGNHHVMAAPLSNRCVPIIRKLYFQMGAKPEKWARDNFEVFRNMGPPLLRELFTGERPIVNPLHALILASRINHPVDLMRILLEDGVLAESFGKMAAVEIATVSGYCVPWTSDEEPWDVYTYLLILNIVHFDFWRTSMQVAKPIVDYLVTYGRADLDKGCRLPAWYEDGSNPYTNPSKTRTPLMMAAKVSLQANSIGLDIVRLLLELGADPNRALDETGEYRNALEAAACGARTFAGEQSLVDEAKVMAVLIGAGAETRSDKTPWTYGSLLSAAALFGGVRKVVYLVKDVRLDLNEVFDVAFHSALGAAVAANCDGMVDILVRELGADVDVLRGDWRVPLDLVEGILKHQYRFLPMNLSVTVALRRERNNVRAILASAGLDLAELVKFGYGEADDGEETYA